MGVSLLILIFIAVILAGLMCYAESVVNPAYSYWDALIWIFVKFVDDPAEMVVAPVTLFGQIVGTLVGFVGIALFAVPAGLIGSGFMDAMRESKRKKELKKFRNIMLRAFKAGVNSELKKYRETLPQEGNPWYKDCEFGSITDNVTVAKFQMQGIELKDIVDVCKEYPEFRIQNEAFARSLGDRDRADRFMVEHFPVNRIYGCCFDRHSKVTIVSPNSRTGICNGNFSYHLAKFAGFNYISADITVADGESYAQNNWGDEMYEGQTEAERKVDKTKRYNKKIKNIYKYKKILRDAFLNDLKELCREEGSWVIFFLAHNKRAEHNFDIHFSHTFENSCESTISTGIGEYNSIVSTLQTNFPQDLKLTIESSDNFHFTKNDRQYSLFYKLQKEGCKCNGFMIHVSHKLMQFSTKLRIIQFFIAKTMHETLEPEHRLLSEEIADMNRTIPCYGYPNHEQLVDDFKEDIIKMREE